MNIFFDYDTTPSNHIADKYLSRILIRIKSEIISLTKSITQKIDKPTPEGYILITLKPSGTSKKVLGFDEELRKKLSKAIEPLDLSKIIQNSPNP